MNKCKTAYPYRIKSPCITKGLSAKITNELKLLPAGIILRAGKKGHGAFLFCVFFSKFISLNSFMVLSASDIQDRFILQSFFSY